MEHDTLFAAPTPAPASRSTPAVVSETAASSSAVPVAPANEDAALRQWVLAESVKLLTASGPQTARQLADALVQRDARADRRLVNRVLMGDGARLIRYDSARYLFSLRV